jgi:polyvinyl alcohol dehydrogenase (cytochrome)
MKHVSWIALALSLALSPASAQTGAELFEKYCATCHKPDSPTRAPRPGALRKMTSQAIMETLNTGSMMLQAAALTLAQRVTVAEYLAAKEPVERSNGPCPTPAKPLHDLRGWNGWSPDLTNTRSQDGSAAGLDAVRTARLKLKWAFGYPGAITAYGEPTIVGGHLFVTSATGAIYALDAKTGCTFWTFQAAASVRTAISAGPLASHYAVYFGDQQSNAYAVDASTGALIWKTHVEQHPLTNLTGSPKLYRGRLYVPVSAGTEEFAATDPKYPCCTARGSVVALDAATGKQIWKTYTIPDPPGPVRKTAEGVQLMGPSGASVWSSPTIDGQRQVLYIGTGNDHSEPETRYSDAVMALDLGSGSMLWLKQLTAQDRWNVACASPTPANCPKEPGGDHDIGASPILVNTGDGKRLLLVSQKSGVMSALDPDNKGAIVWQTRIGHGGVLGGILWGAAADSAKVYAPLSDWDQNDPSQGGGLFALRITDGAKLWNTPPPKPACAGTSGCTPAQMAAATVIAGVVFSGSMDGHLRAYSTDDGKIIWDFDTGRDFPSVNGVKARGGSMSGSGPVVSDGMLFVNAGYAQIGGMPGNVLLAFGAD